MKIRSRSIVAIALWSAIGRPLPDVAGQFRAVDGDSLRGPQGDVRLYGIDAPELDQTCLDSRSEPRWTRIVPASRDADDRQAGALPRHRS